MTIDRQMLAAWCAPMLLLAVATLQFFLVHKYGLSQWKGGGFGMFSTVDAPSARFVRIYLLTDNGEIPVMLPEGLRRTGLAYRTFPVESDGHSLAHSIAEKSWVYVRMENAVEYYRQLRRSQQIGDASELDSESDSLQPDISQFDFKAFKFVRPVEHDEQLSEQDELVNFNSIRLELWKYQFDRAKQQLYASMHQTYVVDKTRMGGL